MIRGGLAPVVRDGSLITIGGNAGVLCVRDDGAVSRTTDPRIGVDGDSTRILTRLVAKVGFKRWNPGTSTDIRTSIAGRSPILCRRAPFLDRAPLRPAPGPRSVPRCDSVSATHRRA